MFCRMAGRGGRDASSGQTLSRFRSEVVRHGIAETQSFLLQKLFGEDETHDENRSGP